VLDDQRQMAGREQRAGRQLETARLRQGEARPALAADAVELATPRNSSSTSSFCTLRTLKFSSSPSRDS
jgi:hypothetical protein